MAGMSAMEKMVANMLGLSPEEMHKMISGFSTLATELKAQLDRVEMGLESVITAVDALNGRLEQIEERLLQNVGSIGNDDGSGGNPGGRTGDGDAR